MTVLHEGLFTFQKEVKRAKISGRPILSFSRKMLASYIMWMDDTANDRFGEALADDLTCKFDAVDTED